MPLPFIRSDRCGRAAYEAYLATHPEEEQVPWTELTNARHIRWDEFGYAVMKAAYDAWVVLAGLGDALPFSLLSHTDQQTWTMIHRAVLDADAQPAT
jgi:hypothetical protein